MKRLSVLMLALALAWAGDGFGYEGYTAVGPVGEKIVELARAASKGAGFNGAVLAAMKGKVIAAVGVGTTGGKDDQPIEVSTLFEIASCTKPFTAVAVMRLTEQGKLSLDDPIAKHLPGVPESCSGITVRHLLQHTSGIPGTNSSGRGKDLAKVLPTFLAGGPQHEPGTHHEYWNQGYSLLSEVIAEASGKSYTRYVRDEVFKPAGMESSCFNGNRAPKGILVATGRSEQGDRSALDHPYGDEYGFQYRGMGGIVTNLIDIWKWDRALATHKLLSESSYDEMTTPGPDGYALGWRVWKAPDGQTTHGHTGSVQGFLAAIFRYPESDGCLIVLSAGDDPKPFNQVLYGSQRVLLEKRKPAG